MQSFRTELELQPQNEIGSHLRKILHIESISVRTVIVIGEVVRKNPQAAFALNYERELLHDTTHSSQ